MLNLDFAFKFEAGLYFLFIKKHYCRCGGKLERKVEKIYFKEDGEEAKKLKYESLYTLDTAPIGNITLSKHVFVCSECKKVYSIKEMKLLKI